MIRIVIADDHALVRRSIRALLGQSEDIEIVGEAGNGKEAVELVRELKPDVVIMDVSMPELDGISAASRIRAEHPAGKVIILSMYANQSLVQQALRNGVIGYLLKRTVSEDLLPAVHHALQGEIFLSRGLTT
jgi:DNA-binding NarL/FixJ family response regulator